MSERSIHVVAGVFPAGRQLLLGKRSGERYHGCWEFPGGKQEPRESREEALRREWFEELSLRIERFGEEFFKGDFTTNDGVLFTIFARRIEFMHGAVDRLPAHSKLQWFYPEEILSLPEDEVTLSLKPITEALIEKFPEFR